MRSDGKPDDWVDELEIENAIVKWPFSYFDGRAAAYNNEGDHNFTIILKPEDAPQVADLGWAVKELDPYEEGDDPEFTLKVNISDKFGMPKAYLIRGGRKFRINHMSDFADINRDSLENLDLVLSPSRWNQPGRSGITAYVKELYATVRPSRFGDKYADIEEI